ncbi:MAG: glycosyltransferase family 61 protein [Cyanobacteria bacterium P01_A01_bin.80]
MQLRIKISKLIPIPLYLRTKIKRSIFYILRNIDLFEKVGILVAKRYVQLDNSSAKAIVKNLENVEVYSLKQENEVITNSAIHVSGQNLDYIQPLIARTETQILEIRNKLFSFRNNHLLDEKMNVIEGFGGSKLKDIPIFTKMLPKKVKYLTGTVAYLSNTDTSNYYHWMCLVIPLIGIYGKFLNTKSIDYFYFGNSSLLDFHRETLNMLGIDDSKILQEACIADRIIVGLSSRFADFASVTKFEFGLAPIVKENYLFTRNLFLNFLLPNSRNRRIYVSRGKVKRRKIINESEVINLLLRYGFEIVSMDNKTIAEQAEMFSEASIIVAPHGAALTNLLFIQPETCVIELIPYGYVNNCFYALSNYGNAYYSYLQGKDTNQNNITPNKRDIFIDIDKLDFLCSKAFAMERSGLTQKQHNPLISLSKNKNRA